MKKILILGAGAAGSIVANKVARELRREIAREKLEITILDKKSVNANPGCFTFIPFGLNTREDATRPMEKIISPRVNKAFEENGEVQHVDLENRSVTVKSGKKYRYDYLVIATGVRLDHSIIPGLSKGINTFYTLNGALNLRKKVNDFNGGKITIFTPQMPIACPGAPGKFVILLDDYLRHIRGIRDKAEINLIWPVGNIGPPVYNKSIMDNFERRGINVNLNFKTQEVDPEKKEVVSVDGERIGYDLLVTVPPHKGIKPLLESGITDENGWIPIDKNTLQYYKSPSEKYDEVYTIGDAGPSTINKMGINAHFQALTTGQNLIYDFKGTGVKALYYGEQGCPIVESSYTQATDGKAFMVTWTYNNPAKPFNTTKIGWLIYRMYYCLYYDLTIKAIM